MRAAWRITKFFARESCGQCTPCREGSGWIERAMYRIEHGGGRMEDFDLLLDLCDNIAPGLDLAAPTDDDLSFSVPPSRSSITRRIAMFRDEFVQHVHDGRCPFD